MQVRCRVPMLDVKVPPAGRGEGVSLIHSIITAFVESCHLIIRGLGLQGLILR